MKIIGVTGGVGAGKSTVLDYLKETYHAHLILADLVGHEVMEPGLPAYDAIIETFGREILNEDQTERILEILYFIRKRCARSLTPSFIRL